MTDFRFVQHAFTLLIVLIVLSFACISGITADEKHTTVSGRVLSAEGDPVPGASIILGVSTVQTDSEGRFIFHQSGPKAKPDCV